MNCGIAEGNEDRAWNQSADRGLNANPQSAIRNGYFSVEVAAAGLADGAIAMFVPAAGK